MREVEERREAKETKKPLSISSQISLLLRLSSISLTFLPRLSHPKNSVDK
jgi:hypothetical protein